MQCLSNSHASLYLLAVGRSAVLLVIRNGRISVCTIFCVDLLIIDRLRQDHDGTIIPT
jgi:hypothetical protein